MKFRWLFFLVFIFSISLSSCKSYKESRKAKNSEKKIETQQEKNEKQAEKEYKKLVKTHHKRQTDKTRARMKETKMRSEYYNRNKKISFFQRLFGNKKDCNKSPKKKRKNAN